MTTETTATYIDSLQVSAADYPAGTDLMNVVDDQLRLIKGAIKRTFPNVTGIVNASDAQLNATISMVRRDLTTTVSATVVFAARPTFIGVQRTVPILSGYSGIVDASATHISVPAGFAASRTGAGGYLVTYGFTVAASTSNTPVILLTVREPGANVLAISGSTYSTYFSVVIYNVVTLVPTDSRFTFQLLFPV